MDYLRLTEELKAQLRPLLERNFPDRPHYFELNHWHENRFVQLQTVLTGDRDIHYEYMQGFVELHLEGKYSDYEYNGMWRRLVETSAGYASLSWHRWARRNQGRCRYKVAAASVEDIVCGFKLLSGIFDSVLCEYAGGSHNEVTADEGEDMEPRPADGMKVDELTTSIRTVGELAFENFVIPEYQRPYKWSVRNVNQLIDDLITFHHNREYRLGTLVLNDNNIVDGQQRIVTLALLLYVLFEKEEKADRNRYPDFHERMKDFWLRTKFKNAHSIAHVRENMEAIRERADELDGAFLSYLLGNCQFVVVQLPEISEAFQFFDFQNARGKDLEPHDLLKAFHLREITSPTEADLANITRWQEQKTERLVGLFLAMFRVKKWSESHSGREFTKSRIDAFKGISLDSLRYPYYMQQIICHYFSETYARDPFRRIDEAVFRFPFQLDQIGINGSRFFDMVNHYNGLYDEIRDDRTFLKYDTEEDQKSAYKIVRTLNSYGKRSRKGDIYVRRLFDCLLLYYVDRFGYEEINKVVRKLFRYAYRVRLEHHSVQLATVDNEAVGGKMFRCIRDAKRPADIINMSVDCLDRTAVARTADNQIIDLYFFNRHDRQRN